MGKSRAASERRRSTSRRPRARESRRRRQIGDVWKQCSYARMRNGRQPSSISGTTGRHRSGGGGGVCYTFCMPIGVYQFYRPTRSLFARWLGDVHRRIKFHAPASRQCGLRASQLRSAVIPTRKLNRPLSDDDRRRTDRVTTPTRVGLGRYRSGLDRATRHASSRLRAADDVTIKTH